MASDRVGEMKGRVGEVEHSLGEGDDDSGSMEFTRPSEGRARTCGSLIGLGLAHGEGDGESIVDFHEGLLLDPVDDVGDCLGEDMPDLATSSCMCASRSGWEGVCGDDWKLVAGCSLGDDMTGCSAR